MPKDKTFILICVCQNLAEIILNWRPKKAEIKQQSQPDLCRKNKKGLGQKPEQESGRVVGFLFHIQHMPPPSSVLLKKCII